MVKVQRNEPPPANVFQDAIKDGPIAHPKAVEGPADVSPARLGQGDTVAVADDAARVGTLDAKGSAVADSAKAGTIGKAPPAPTGVAIADVGTAEAIKPNRSTGVFASQSYRSTAADAGADRLDPKVTGQPSPAVSATLASASPPLAVGGSSGTRTG